MRFMRCYGCMEELTIPDGVCPHCGYDNTNDPRKQPEKALPCGAVLAGRYVTGRVLDIGDCEISYLSFDLKQTAGVCIREYFPEAYAERGPRPGFPVRWIGKSAAQEDKPLRERIVSEMTKAIGMRRLSSVPQVLDVFEENNTVYFVTDHVKGDTLHSCKHSEGPMTEEACIRPMLPLMRDLRELQTQGILCRSISPKKLVRRADGSLSLRKLELNEFLQLDDRVDFWPSSFDPIEKCSRKGQIGPWTEVYMLCAVIVYCCSDKKFPTLADRANGEELDLSAFSPQVKTVLTHGLAIKPADRIQNVEELCGALEAALEQKGIDGSAETEQEAPAAAQPGSGPTLPDTQPVSNTAPLDRMPDTQPVSNTAPLDRMPDTQPVSNTAPLDRMPDTQPGSSTATPDMMPNTEPVSSTATPDMLHDTQPVDPTAAQPFRQPGDVVHTAPQPDIHTAPQPHAWETTRMPERDGTRPSVKGGGFGRKKPASGKKLFLFIGAAVLALLVIGFFTIHIWKPATCTEPEKCVFCGKVRAPALGHVWVPATCTEPETCSVCGAVGAAALGHKYQPATCTEPEICSVCGATGAAALGHDWQEATYDAPKTCSRCGASEGRPLGYVGTLSGQWGNTPVTLRDGSRGYAYELDSAAKNCIRLTLGMVVTDYSGHPFGVWYLYARDLNGYWSHIGEFTIPRDLTKGNMMEFTFTFDPAASFDALSIVGRDMNDYNIDYRLAFYDAQMYVG